MIDTFLEHNVNTMLYLMKRKRLHWFNRVFHEFHEYNKLNLGWKLRFYSIKK